MLMQEKGDKVSFIKYVSLLCVTLLFVGCSSKQVEYVDRPVEVKVPVQCQVSFPTKPKTDVSPEGLGKVLVYTEELECALRLCRGESCSSN